MTRKEGDEEDGRLGRDGQDTEVDMARVHVFADTARGSHLLRR
ncbi:hypothetical protein [Streptomyces sp. NPDC050759]